MADHFARALRLSHRFSCSPPAAATNMVMSARKPLAGLLATLAVALIYFGTARLGLLLLEPVDGVAVFWPAAGVASGILIAVGSAARWPVVAGVAIATIAANLTGDRNIWSSLCFAAANAGETLVGGKPRPAFLRLAVRAEGIA
jgi:hypothetical protein